MPYTGTNLSACGVTHSPNGDVNADSTINVTSHEQMEAATDPYLNAWYDANGAENSDKCAWTFGAQLLTFTNRSQWKVQGNWSNSGYDGNRGYSDPAKGFVRGCVDGTN